MEMKVLWDYVVNKSRSTCIYYSELNGQENRKGRKNLIMQNLSPGIRINNIKKKNSEAIIKAISKERSLNLLFKEAAELIKNSNRVTAFTGAGISVESGIPPFRGENGLWNKYNPIFLDIAYFKNNPEDSWKLIKEIFYDFFGKAEPNEAHLVLAKMEKNGWLDSIITQNIDNLHQKAGSEKIYEFHGNSRNLICPNCSKIYNVENVDLSNLPPRCKYCGTVLKPDFVFFGEEIPKLARTNSFRETEKADVFILIGTTGEIMPASTIPYEAKKKNKKIIEINIQPSAYTNTITDVFLKGKATVIMQKLFRALLLKSN